MKKLFCLLAAAALLCGCHKNTAPINPRQWEYKVVVVKNFAGSMKQSGYDDMATNTPRGLRTIHAADAGAGEFLLDDGLADDYRADLQKLGSDGWELICAIPQTETVPGAVSFTDQSFNNVRTGKLTLIFKRPE